jgi:apolipoprotein D and lipocalin family protein
MNKAYVVTLLIMLNGCNSTQDLKVVDNFELSKFSGKWYEIARLDNQFEKNLIGVTLFYNIGEQGDVEVIHRGFNQTNNSRYVAKGKAHFVKQTTQGHLEIKFSTLSYSDYKVLELDKNYEYALITSDSFDYLWILARDPILEDAIYQQLIDKAHHLGFNTAALIKISHLCGC